MDQGNEGPKPPAEDVAKAEQPANDTGFKPIIQRFVPFKGADSLAKATEERLKEVAATPPAEVLKSSQWRRDLLKPNEGTAKPQGGTSSSGNTSSV